MLRFVFLVVLVVVLSTSVRSEQTPYQATISGTSHDVPWLPISGTQLQNIPWGYGTLLPLPAPQRPMPMFGLEFAQSDTVQLYVSGNGSFLINTPSLLALADGVFTELDSTLPGASVGYQFVESVSDPMIRVRFDSVSIARLGAPNFVCFELQYHFADGAFDILYGPSSENTRTISNPEAQPFAGISLVSAEFTVMYQKVWLHGDPTDLRTDTTRTVTFPAMRGVPVRGTHIHFEPVTTTDVDDLTDASGDWSNAAVSVYDLMGRHVASTTTTANGTLALNHIVTGPVLMVNTVTHNSRLVLVQ
ncbi:MAG: hypothetical protein IPF59_11920 [Ignavibacteria bacterium]|nr:hypothetical protein [Ignavibacteria bacterium]